MLCCCNIHSLSFLLKKKSNETLIHLETANTVSIFTSRIPIICSLVSRQRQRKQYWKIQCERKFFPLQFTHLKIKSVFVWKKSNNDFFNEGKLKMEENEGWIIWTFILSVHMYMNNIVFMSETSERGNKVSSTHPICEYESFMCPSILVSRPAFAVSREKNGLRWWM